jgi:hypothetical protein
MRARVKSFVGCAANACAKAWAMIKCASGGGGGSGTVASLLILGIGHWAFSVLDEYNQRWAGIFS